MVKINDHAVFSEAYTLIQKSEFFIAGQVAALSLLEALEIEEVVKNQALIEQMIELDNTLMKHKYVNRCLFMQGFLGILQVSVS